MARSLGHRTVTSADGGAIAGLAARSILVLAMLAGPAWAQDAGGPTPKAVIYPGDVIRDDMLADSPDGGVRDGGGPFVEDRVARRRQGGAADPPARARDPLRGRLQPQARRQWRGSEARLQRGRPPHHDARARPCRTARSATSSGCATATAASPCPAPCSRTAPSGSAADEARARRRAARLPLRRAGGGGADQGHFDPARRARQPAGRLRPRRRAERHRRHVRQRALYPAGRPGHAAEPRHGPARHRSCATATSPR